MHAMLRVCVCSSPGPPKRGEDQRSVEVPGNCLKSTARVLRSFEIVFINTSCQIPEHCEKLQTHTYGPVLKTNVKHYASTTRSVNASITRI